MSLDAATKWNVRTDGDDTNGGAFVVGASGTDHSLQAAAQYSVTDAVTNGTTTITSATANFGTDVIGNILYIQGGTGSITANRYQITARPSTTEITVDRSTGLTSGTGATLKIGGALVSPGLVTSSAPCSAVVGNLIYVKSGTYTISNTTAGTSNSRVNPGVRVRIEGYDVTQGDLAARPILSASGISSTTIVNAIIGYRVTNIEADGNSLSSLIGFTGLDSFFYLCKATDCSSVGFSNNTDTTRLQCEASGCGSGFSDGRNFGCISHDNTNYGFATGRNYFCISYDNGLDGFLQNQDGHECIGCISYSNTDDGFSTGSSDNTNVFINCIAESNGGYGFNVGASGFSTLIANCGTFGNTSGATNGVSEIKEIGNVSGSGSFFTNAASFDFNLNNTAGAGAALREVGFPSSLPVVTGTGFSDIGTFQHECAAAGSGGGIRLAGHGGLAS